MKTPRRAFPPTPLPPQRLPSSGRGAAARHEEAFWDFSAAQGAWGAPVVGFQTSSLETNGSESP